MITGERTGRAPSRRLTVAVVVCTSTLERAQLVAACIDSLLVGERKPDELILVVNDNPSLKCQLAGALPECVRVIECGRLGLSEARNAGIEVSGSDVVAFVDDDATADYRWLSSLMATFENDDQILGGGGPVVPVWGGARRWMPDELLWVVGCTYSGHRQDAGPIRNPIGCNMAFRRRELIAAGNFSGSFGKRGNALQTCDETELGLRVERLHGPDRIRYVPDARVQHLVPPDRISWRMLVRRSLSEGLAKGRLHRLYTRPALGPERRYARLLLTEKVPRLILEGARRRDRDRVVGAIAILASLGVTGAAFVAGFVREQRRQARALGVAQTKDCAPVAID